MELSCIRLGHYRSAYYSADGKRIVSIGDSNLEGSIVAVWNSDSVRKELELEFEGVRRSLEIQVARFVRAGGHIIVLPDESMEYNGGIRVIDLVTGQQVFHLGRDEGFCEFDLSLNGSTLLAVGRDWNSVRAWNYETGELVLSREVDPGGELSAVVAPNGSSFLLATESMRPAVLIDVATGREISNFPEGYWSGAFSPDDERILLWSDKVDLWDLKSGAKLCDLGAANFAGFSPGGRYIFTADFNSSRLKIWDTTTAEVVHESYKFRTQQWYAGWERGAPAFSPDGKFLACCEEQLVNMRVLETGETVQQFELPHSVVTSVAFRPFGQQMLVTAWTKVHTRSFSGWAPETYVLDLLF